MLGLRPWSETDGKAPSHFGECTSKENEGTIDSREGIIDPNTGQSLKTTTEQSLPVNLQSLKWKLYIYNPLQLSCRFKST